MSDTQECLNLLIDIANCYDLSPQDIYKLKRIKEKIISNYTRPVKAKVSYASKVKKDVFDYVNNPKHYDLFADGTKSFDVISKTLTPEEYKGFLKGNILKYRLRAGKKGDASICIDKANWYANKLAEFVESQKVNNND